MSLTKTRHLENEEIESTIQLLSQAVDFHIEWLQEFHESLICGSQPGESIVSSQAHQICKLGQWYYNQAPALLHEIPEFQQLESLHHSMHDAARSLIHIHQAGGVLCTDDYRHFIEQQQELTRLLLSLKDRLVNTFHSFDSLTGAINRDAFSYIADHEAARAERTQQTFVLALLDLDHFKGINDTYGHIMGDHALKAVAQFLLNRIRKSDTLCRYGGEEFLILLPGTTHKDAVQVVDAIRQQVADTEFELSNSLTLQLTLSAGVAEWSVGKTVQQVLKEADEKLYQAKASGRNRTIA